MRASTFQFVALLPSLSLVALAASSENTTEALRPVYNIAEKQRSSSNSNSSVIEGLINVAPRQGCDKGWGECPNYPGLCAPIGSQCCSSTYYCKPGSWCYATGCCKNSQRGCEHKGCCDKGWECCADGGCCWPGTYCAWYGGEVVCYPTGGGGGGQTTHTTTHHTTAIPTSTSQTTYSTTAIPTSTSQTTYSTTATYTYSVITTYTAVPAPPSGYQNVQVEWDDPNWTWSGTWVEVAAACNATSKAKRCAGNDIADSSITYYTFIGTAVYLDFASSNVDFAIYLDYEKVVEYGGLDPTSIPNNCTISWAVEGLSVGSHSLSISVYGVAFSALSSRALDGPWWLELNNLVVRKAATGTSTQSTVSPTTTGGLGSSGDGALGLCVNYGIVEAFLVGSLVLFLM